MNIDTSREVTFERNGNTYHAHYRHVGDELTIVSGFTSKSSPLGPCSRAEADSLARELLAQLVDEGRASLQPA